MQIRTLRAPVAGRPAGNAICEMIAVVSGASRRTLVHMANAIISVGGALALVPVLMLLDGRVRERIVLVFDTRHPGATLTTLAERASEVAAIVVMAVREQSFGHAPLVIFGVASAVLFVFMLRT